MRRVLSLAIVCLLATAGVSAANTSHDGWPAITGTLMMNKHDQSRTLDARIPGVTAVPAGTAAPLPIHHNVSKVNQGWAGSNARPTWLGHNELLGGHGSDTIYAGPMGDVIWGDFKPSGQPSNQHDNLHGGAGNDWIYASHGYNHIWTGAGTDHIMLVYGHGIVECNGPGPKILTMRKLASNRHYRLVGCRHKQIIPFAA